MFPLVETLIYRVSENKLYGRLSALWETLEGEGGFIVIFIGTIMQGSAERKILYYRVGNKDSRFSWLYVVFL